MNLYLVANPAGKVTWVAYEDDEARIWSYVQNTGRFHLNNGLYLDFYFEHTNTYRPITRELAQRAMDDGVGEIDARVLGHMVDRFRADPASQTAQDVLGATPIPTIRALTTNRVELLILTPAGQWFTWRSYPKAKKQLAFSSATGIRVGKVKALRKFPNLDVRVVEDGDYVSVQLARV